MDTIDEGKSNRHVAVTSKTPPGCSVFPFCFETSSFWPDGSHFSLRHEWAQLQESQYFPDKRQTGEHSDRAEAQRQTLPGGSRWQWKGTEIQRNAASPDAERSRFVLLGLFMICAKVRHSTWLWVFVIVRSVKQEQREPCWMKPRTSTSPCRPWETSSLLWLKERSVTPPRLPVCREVVLCGL